LLRGSSNRNVRLWLRDLLSVDSQASILAGFLPRSARKTTGMRHMLSATIVAALALAVPVIPAVPAPAATPAPAPTGTLPPQIYHIITRPLCTVLHQHIAPAVGMMLQNDATIKKSPALFSEFNRDQLYGVDNSVSNTAGGTPPPTSAGSPGTLNASQNMTLLRMENMISPLAQNIIAIQKQLDDPILLDGTGAPQDDQQLRDIRDKLLKALATQNAALDLINGFVQTQQMGDLQHEGQEYINAANQTDTTQTITGTPSPQPLLQDPNQAGLAPNPYSIDLAAVPGLTLGYNPTTRLVEAMNWTIKETAAREEDAAKALQAGAAICSGSVSSTPTPSP
jgi:hypothetical protein